jgi:hypothetical protein
MLKLILISALAYVTLGLSISSKLNKQKEVTDFNSFNKNHPNLIRRNNAIHKDAIYEIRNRTSLWKTYEPDQHPFANKTDSELRGMIGAMNADDDDDVAAL